MTRHMGFGQMTTHRIGCRAAVTKGGFDQCEDLPLAIVAVGQGERYQRLERDRSGPIVIDELRRDCGQFHAFANMPDGHPEPTGDILLASAAIDQRRKCFEFVGGMHGSAHDVLGKRGLEGGFLVVDETRHQYIRRNRSLRSKRLQRLQPATAGMNEVSIVLTARHDAKVLFEAVRQNRSLELGILGGTRFRLADVLR
nr:hypothetical protein [Fulvimarina manganoxydans]